MSTIDHRARVAPPRLVDGERLDRATLHERYAAMPEDARAELIGGIVYMASPLRRHHGKKHFEAITWLGHYFEATPGVEALDDASVFLGDDGELQPDVSLRILPESGGRTIDAGDYSENGPELVLEVSDSSLGLDLGPKLADYERAGVPEYVVLGVKPPAVRWHRLTEGRLIEVAPEVDGIYRSGVFPGLWLDPAALLAGDTRRVREVVDLGVATRAHANFVAGLAEAGGAGRG